MSKLLRLALLAGATLLAAGGISNTPWAAEAQPPEAGEPDPSSAQDAGPEAEPEEIFIDRVEVNVVNVDVYVTDKKGNRVTGLTVDDFELYEDDKLMPITNFYEVRGRERVTPLAAETIESLPVERYEPGPFVAQEAPPEQQLYLVVYIDNFNIRPLNRNRILGELRRFLIEKTTTDDQVMVISYDRSLHIRQPFTSDRRLVAKATMEMEMLTGHASQRDSERRQALDRIEEAQTPFEAQSVARSYAQSVENDLTFTLRAMKEIVGSLSGLPGRKALLYVSDGIPMVAGQDLYLAIDQKFTQESTTLMESLNFDFSRQYQELANLANASGVTFYTLDAQGLQVNSSVSAEERGRSVGFVADNTRQANLQSPLRFLANATGGRAILNTNNVFNGLERVADDFTSFYSLGYTPSHYGDGRYYDIKVKVRQKGLVLRYREGYRDLSTSTRMNDGTFAALYYNYQSNPLGVSLEFEPGTKREDGFYLVPIKVRIPLSRLALVPRSSTYESRVRVWVGAMDDRGTSPVQQMPVPISIPQEQIDAAREQFYVYTITLLMRGGEQKVAVGVRDEFASESAFVTRSIRLASR